jgi:hypothetical protein
MVVPGEFATRPKPLTQPPALMPALTLTLARTLTLALARTLTLALALTLSVGKPIPEVAQPAP